MRALKHQSRGEGAMPTNVGTLNDDNINDAVSNIIYGLDGNDTIFSSSSGLVYIYGGQGIDTIDYSDLAGGNAEIYGGAGADTIDGGSNADAIYGGDDQDVITGWHGNDYIEGGRGNDQLYGDAGSDTIYGGDGADLLFGGEGADKLDGGSWDDVLDGGTGADTMIGGLGNDIFEVDDVGDFVEDSNMPGGGIDTVRSTISFSLANLAHVSGAIERLVLKGDGNIAGTGNALDNIIDGNSGNNVLSGLGGNDTLDGGDGADTMYGGANNDTYEVDNVGDKVDESIAGSGGIDTVLSKIGFSLANTGARVSGAFENLTLIGGSAVNGVGNSLDNIITGNSASNSLNGSTGHDTLNGKLGNDTLNGSAGLDIFVFDTTLNAATNVDTIVGYFVDSDTIQLDNDVMAGLGATLGTLGAEKLWRTYTGVAHDADDRIIYQIHTGKLFYDADGNGAGGSIHFATLDADLALTNADFVVI
ncbi:calcium-binding protein [Mesorhizobium sp. L-8-3]|uniref:calcium-binding protein n=1 Tax=Mesorhizobium sp. L-8-3 TaxID=2744522 RepID=UPI001928BCC8|nr:calcium-binding protein [Mesorhizobium sp. L-8-3]